MTTQRDYYEVLGVARTANGDEIKRAYRKLAFENHPDRNPEDPDAEQRFKDAAEAYEVLRDAEKRARYDQFGHAGVSGGFGAGGFSSTEDIFSAFGDIFSEFFGFSGGGRSRGPRPRAGADLRYSMTISFREAASGVEKTISIPREIPCEECDGSGAAPGHEPEPCKQCGGVGQIHQSQGFFRIAVTCPVCRGEGTVIANPCPKCRGRGRNQEMRDLTVRVPAGVDNGSRLRLRGEGEPGEYGGPPGDLYVVITVEEDKVFERHGQDIVYHATVSMVDAALGKKIEVPTLDEPVTVEVPRGTQSGEQFKLKGKGLPYLGSEHSGNLIVVVTVKTPTRLSHKQEELLREFKQAEEEKPMTRVKNFFKKAVGGEE